MIGLNKQTTQSTQSSYFPASEQSPTSHPQSQSTTKSANRHPASPPNKLQPSRQRGGTRSTSKSGGVQVTLDETGSWSELANQKVSVPGEDANGEFKGQPKPHGVLGFLSRKKGRERSPKPQEPGVLGKEGARVVINSGGR